MEFFKVLEKRHCVRRFDPKKEVSDEQIEKLLKAATLAPSEGNLQPWYLVVIKKQSLRSKLEEARFLPKNIFATASILIVVCIDTEIAFSKYGERGLELFSIQSTAVAAEHIFLEATNLGIGACWVGAFNEDKVKDILDLEPNLRPVVIMPVGFSAEKPFLTNRKSIKNISRVIE